MMKFINLHKIKAHNGVVWVAKCPKLQNSFKVSNKIQDSAKVLQLSHSIMLFVISITDSALVERTW